MRMRLRMGLVMKKDLPKGCRPRKVSRSHRRGVSAAPADSEGDSAATPDSTAPSGLDGVVLATYECSSDAK